MYYWSKIDKTAYPSLTQLAEAKKLADLSNDIESISSRELLYTLMKTYKLPRISGNLKTRKTAITVYDWKIEANDGETVADEYLTKVRARLLKPINAILDNCIDFTIYGQYLAEIKYDEPLNGEIRLKINKKDITDFMKIDDDSFIFFDDSQAVNGRIKKDLNDLQTEFLYHTDGIKEHGGDVSAIAENAIYLNAINKEWDIVAKRLKGIPIGSVDGEGFNREASILNLSDKEKMQMITDLQETLAGIGKDSDALTSLKSIEIKLSQIVDSSASGALQIYKNELVDDISIAILGQANTTELPSGGGSRAALQVLAKISADIALQDAILTQRAVNKLLAIDYRLNKDKTAYQAPYSFKFVLDDLIDGESEARKLNYLASSGIDLPLSKKEVYEKLGYSIPIDEADTISIKKDPTTLGGF